ncbi:MAG: OmpA family protein [Alphaproteobacteria bacterium]|nr:OmpA family protein [Alphaproteobacteria bacterium]
MIVLYALLACVPKQKYDTELERALRLESELAESEAAVKALRAEADSIQASLDSERNAMSALAETAEQLDSRAKAQAAQLVELSEKLASMTATNSAQKAAKADLEQLVAELQTKAGEAQSEADAAKERAAKLAADRERLKAEAERLAAEKAKLEQKTAEYDALVGELQGEIDAGQITITELSGKLTVAMSNAILFDSGATTVKPAGQEALAKVAGVLAGVRDREIRVEGHTDNVPVGSGAPYPDNWALSALRASNVVGLLVKGGVDPLNVAAVGYGEHHPATSNDTKEGRAANRRTEIVLVPKLSAAPSK